MAKYYAHIQGARGPASRLGTPSSGIHASIKSWDGQVDVDIRPRVIVNGDTVDWVTVRLCPHSGSYKQGTVTLYAGPASGWEDYHERGDLGRMVWNVEHGRKAA